MQNDVTAASKFGKAEHDLWWPTVSANGVVGAAPVRDDHISNWYGGVGVNINIPVFNGFLFNARAKSADLDTELNANDCRICRIMSLETSEWLARYRQGL